MSKAVNTIARGIEAGALKAGASQYLEAIEAAQKKLANNQILFTAKYTDGVTSSDNTQKTIVLQQYEKPQTTIEEILAYSVEEIYLPSTINGIDSVFLDNVDRSFLKFINLGETKIKNVYAPFLSECVNIQEDIHLPETLKDIGSRTFVNVGKNTGISIYIPDTVETIGNNAFQGVAHIYYNGTATGAPWGALAMN